MTPFFDNFSFPTTAGTTDLSWSHTILSNLGKTGLVVVGVEVENHGNNISGATFNGVAMTEVIADGNNNSHGCFGKMYELRGANVPAAGVYTVTVTFSGYSGADAKSRAAGAMSFGGVKDQAKEASASVNQTTDNPSVNITTLTKKALVIAFHGNQNDAVPTFSTGETKKIDAAPASGEQSILSGAYKIVDNAGSTTTTATEAGDACFLLLASYAAAPSTAGFFPIL